MIGRLEGRLEQIAPGQVLVDVGGVGYLVHTTLRTIHERGRGGHGALWIHTQVRADAIVLYGFADRQELETFERLIAVAGVGPRIGLAVLSALTPDELGEAVTAGDLARIQRTPGVGRRTAERLVLELRSRLPAAPGAGPDHRADVVSALVNLGYGQREAGRAVDHVLRESDTRDLQTLVRGALRRLTRTP